MRNFINSECIRSIRSCARHVRCMMVLLFSNWHFLRIYVFNGLASAHRDKHSTISDNTGTSKLTKHLILSQSLSSKNLAFPVNWTLDYLVEGDECGNVADVDTCDVIRVVRKIQLHLTCLTPTHSDGWKGSLFETAKQLFVPQTQHWEKETCMRDWRSQLGSWLTSWWTNIGLQEQQHKSAMEPIPYFTVNFTPRHV